MLSVDTIARVVVNAAAQSPAPTSFDTGLLLVKDPNFTDSRRLQTCTSGPEAATVLTALGFGSATDPYKAALKYFGASPSPSRLLISCDSRYRNLSSQNMLAGKTVYFTGITDFRKHACWDPQKFQYLLIPLKVVYVIHHGTGRI